MVDEPQTYADGRNVLTALETLGALVESGQASERQRKIYESLQRQASAAERQVNDTRSTYRGFHRGVTVGLNDNIAGAANVVTGRGTYQEGRESALERDREARLNNPEAFQRGQFAGGGTLAGATLPLIPSFGGGMASQMMTGALGGGGMGYATGMGEYELDGSPPGEQWNYVRAPTVIGAATGAAAPVAGRMAGAATRAIRNARALETVPGAGRVPMQTLTRNWQQAADAGADIQQYLGGLTDEAALVDVPGPMRATGQGLAAMRGEGGMVLERFVNERAAGAGERIAQDLDRHIAPARRAFDERRRLANERTSRLGPQYDVALAAPDRIEVGTLIGRLRQRAALAGADTAPALNRYLNSLEAKMDDAGTVDAAALHWERSDLSDALGRIDGPSKNNALLNEALAEFDSVLDSNVPGYADARGSYADNRAMERAIDDGAQVLRGGRYSAMSPEEFEESFSRLTDAEKDALRSGLRRDIAALMGTARNDAAAAWGDLSKEWNEEKLRIALGEDVANDLIARVRSERAFSETRGDLVGGSQTGLRRGAREALDPQYAPPEQGQRPGPIGRVRNAANDMGNSIVDAIIYGNRNSDRNLQLGQMLSATGGDRDRLVQAIIANSQRQQQPSVMDQRFDRLVRALMAGSGGSAATLQN